VEVRIPWYQSITARDLLDILPGVIILLLGLSVMGYVIPYAFSSVLRQMEQEARLNRMREIAAVNANKTD